MINSYDIFGVLKLTFMSASTVSVRKCSFNVTGWKLTHRGLVIYLVHRPEEVQAPGRCQLPLVWAVCAQRVQDLAQQVHLPRRRSLCSCFKGVVTFIEVSRSFFSIFRGQPGEKQDTRWWLRDPNAIHKATSHRRLSTDEGVLKPTWYFCGRTAKWRTGSWPNSL